MKIIDKAALPMEISYPESQNWSRETEPCQPTFWERFKCQLAIAWENQRVQITLFNVLAAIYWTLMGVLLISVSYLYLSRH